MKKQNIIIISVIVIVIIVACVFLLMGKNINQNNNLNPQNQNIEESTIASLSIGNWVSVVTEKVNGTYSASRIMACDDKDSCQTGPNNQGDTTKTPPIGAAPTGDMPTPPTGDQGAKTGSMENKTMLSGTITEVNADSIVLSLDTGETATVLISDSTRINKR
jgi:hypothetical protein